MTPTNVPKTVDLFDAVSIPPNWIIKGLLPDGMTLMVGPAKDAMKSVQAMAMGLMVSGYPNGIYPKFMCRPTREPSTVLYLSAEAEAGEMRSTMEDYCGVRGERHDLFLVVEDPSECMLDTEEGRENITALLNEHQPTLTVIDPLANLHTQDENDATAMLALLLPLRRWAKRHGVAVLVLHHPKKLGEGVTQYKNQDARGSGALSGLIDGQLVITPYKDFLNIKATFKRGAGWERQIVLGVEGETAREHILIDDKGIDGQVRAAVARGVTTVEALCNELGARRSKVAEALGKLKRNGLLDQPKGRSK